METRKGQEWLINLAVLLGYGKNPKGVCFGIMLLARNREKYQEFRQLMEDIHDRKLDMTYTELDPKTNKRIAPVKTKLLAFYDSLNILQHPEEYVELFDQESRTRQQYQVASAQALTQPVERKHENVIVGTVTGAYTMDPTNMGQTNGVYNNSGARYFALIRKQLQALKKTHPDLDLVTLSLLSGNHVESVTYDPQNDCWRFVNAGQLIGRDKTVKREIEVNGKKIPLSPNTEELTTGIVDDDALAQYVREGFNLSANSDRCLFTTLFTATDKDKTIVEASLKELFATKEWESLHDINSAMTAVDTEQYSYEHLVMRNSGIVDTAVLEKIHLYHKKNNTYPFGANNRREGIQKMLETIFLYDYKGDMIDKVLELNPDIEKLFSKEKKFYQDEKESKSLHEIFSGLIPLSPVFLIEKYFKFFTLETKEDVKIVMNRILFNNRADVLKLFLDKSGPKLWSVDNLERAIKEKNLACVKVFLEYQKKNNLTLPWTKLIADIPDDADDIQLLMRKERALQKSNIIEAQKVYVLQVISGITITAKEAMEEEDYENFEILCLKKIRSYARECCDPKNEYINVYTVENIIKQYYEKHYGEEYTKVHSWLIIPIGSLRDADCMREKKDIEVNEKYYTNKIKYHEMISDSDQYLKKITEQCEVGSQWIEEAWEKCVGAASLKSSTDDYALFEQYSNSLSIVEYAYLEMEKEISERLNRMNHSMIKMAQELRESHHEGAAEQLEAQYKNHIAEWQDIQTKVSRTRQSIEAFRQLKSELNKPEDLKEEIPKKQEKPIAEVKVVKLKFWERVRQKLIKIKQSMKDLRHHLRRRKKINKGEAQTHAKVMDTLELKKDKQEVKEILESKAESDPISEEMNRISKFLEEKAKEKKVDALHPPKPTP